MKTTLAFLLTVFCALGGISEGRKGFGPGEQEFGYVDVRPGAHMFYWLYYTTAQKDYASRPLVMWLQGGPGGSSTSFGNFNEIGPLDADLKPRNSTWVRHVNLLLVDNPVGTGFSYVNDKNLLTKTNKEIATDLVELMRGFLKAYPTFEKVPFYIFCESYGGKMTAEFALELEKERKANKIKVNLQGVGLGDSWISPIDSVLTWAPYLLQAGLVDQNGFDMVDEAAQQTAEAVKRGDYDYATNLWSYTEQTIMNYAGNVDFYNILTPIRSFPLRSSPNINELLRSNDFGLESLMNGPVRDAFGDTIPSKVRHRVISSEVFSVLWGDFMKPVTDVVEELLNTTSLDVVVYNGQLDLIVDTPGTVHWVDRLKWPSANTWNTSADRRTFNVHGVVEGFVKKVKNLSFYWINRAGHMVPSDNPAATIELLRIVTKFDQKNNKRM